MAAYYNEIDSKAAQWLRELIELNMIAPGEVDERSIEDVLPSELVGYTQCHFFAGVGVWSHALRCAGWPDDRPVWTGSCPCQPFSAAGKGGGIDDERHLWPAFEWLIRQCHPGIVLGEQVEAAIKHDWLDHVALSLEAIGYAVGAVGFPACSVGAPHIRQRLYWVANNQCRGCNSTKPITGTGWESFGDTITKGSEEISPARLLADASGVGQYEIGRIRNTTVKCWTPSRPPNVGNAGELGDSGIERCEGYQPKFRQGGDRELPSKPGPTNGFWDDAEWIHCRDGKSRPTGRGIHPIIGRMVHTNLRRCEGGRLRVGGKRSEPQRSVDTGQQYAMEFKSCVKPLADGPSSVLVRGGHTCPPDAEIDPQNSAEAMVMRLRGYGNSLVLPVAVEFIRAVMDVFG